MMNLRTFSIAAILAVLLVPPLGAAAQESATSPAAPAASPAVPAAVGVSVPNFWDPRARLERPDPADIGPIRFLTSDDFSPFSFRDRRGMLIGFDVELAQAICKVLKAPCAIQTRPFDTLKAGLADGTGNAILAGFDPERAGAEGLIASQAYLKIPGRFVARKAAPFDPASAPVQAQIGVVCGSAHQIFLERFFPKLKLACRPNASAGLEELKAGRLAAFFGDALGLSFWLHGEASQDCCAFAGGPYLDDHLFGGGLSIVMKADDRKLKLAIDYALREVYRSGTYEELYLRYFPVSLF
jgi:polar amino acid transport system substrate-binding protein